MIFIIGDSALSYWLDGKNRKYPDERILSDHHLLNGYDKNDYEKAVNFALHNNFTLPVQVALPRNKMRHDSKVFSFKPIPQNMPPGSFMKLDEDIYVATPEATFLMAATRYPYQLLTRFGCDLCARYVRDNSLEMAQRFRTPVTDSGKIRRYINTIQNYPGIKAARMVTEYISDNSNSPVESVLACCGNIPAFQGGFTTGKVILNNSVNLSEEGALLFGRDSCSCDLMWEDSILIGEYDSKKAHLSPEQMEWDKKKSTALSISGYKVINITPSNLSTFEKTEELFLMLRKELGFRTRKEKWQEYRDMRRETYNLLFNRREKPKEQLTETSRMSL